MTNSVDWPTNHGQVSVFQSPHHPDVLLADIALFDRRGHLEWYAIDHDSTLYRCAIEDYDAGILTSVNYSLFLDSNGKPV